MIILVERGGVFGYTLMFSHDSKRTAEEGGGKGRTRGVFGKKKMIPGKKGGLEGKF